MTISAIIPVYNEQKTIQHCLASLLKQTQPLKEIIIIDDGSTDNTINIINRFQSQHDHIKLLSQSHQGPGVARNKGAQHSQADILVFVDADMEFEPDFIQHLTTPIKNKKAQGAWSSQEFVKNWHNVWARCWNYNNNLSDHRLIAYQDKNQKKVFRAITKSEFDRVNGFDNIGYTDDWTLVTKLAYQPQSTLAKFYHYNPDSLSEVFHQALWIGKRNYKLNHFGTIIAILRANPIFSLIIGTFKAVQYRTIHFIVFKLVYDFGLLLGAVTSLTGKKY